MAFVDTDVLIWSPPRQFSIWYDRAALHFLVGSPNRAHYVQTAVVAVLPGGVAVIGTFAADIGQMFRLPTRPRHRD